MTFHPELRTAARLLPHGLALHRTLPLVRALGKLGGGARDVGVVQVTDTASVRIHPPPRIPTAAAPAPALLWIHGGGLVLGSAWQDDAICRHLAREAGVVVAAVDYRLAPESRFPAALDDCYAAFEWLATRQEIDPARVAVGGASAGGGLAAALALLAADRAGPEPAFQLLVYPMLDDRTAARPDPDASVRRVWDNPSNVFGWQAYLGRPPGSEGVSELAAPARRAGLSGLPPAWLGVGTVDLFHAEDLEYAARLRQAGVPCEVVEVPGAFHGFDAVRSKTGVASDFRAAQVAALRQALRSG